jgi:hypothetical protein
MEDQNGTDCRDYAPGELAEVCQSCHSSHGVIGFVGVHIHVWMSAKRTDKLVPLKAEFKNEKE